MIRLALALTLLAQTALAQTPGHQRLTVPAPHRGAEIPAALWFPATGGTAEVIGQNILFYGAEALSGATLTPGPHPLILVSHGSGGNLAGL